MGAYPNPLSYPPILTLHPTSRMAVTTCSRWPTWIHSLTLQGIPLHTLVNNAGANFMGVQPWATEQGVAGLPQV